MTPTSPSTDHLPAFTTLLEERGVLARARPYFVHWAKLWFTSAAQSSEETTSAFFEDLGRSPKVQPWQFRQAVRSVAWLARDILHLPWAATFDWRGLAESARPLEIDHRTHGRETIRVASWSPGFSPFPAHTQHRVGRSPLRDPLRPSPEWQNRPLPPP